jgi:hypothetical protein
MGGRNRVRCCLDQQQSFRDRDSSLCKRSKDKLSLRYSWMRAFQPSYTIGISVYSDRDDLHSVEQEIKIHNTWAV